MPSFAKQFSHDSPHNGKNLSVEDFGKAVVEALNTGPSYGTKPAKMFVDGWGSDRFDLADLNKPGILQHIASLTRDDVTASAANLHPVPGRIAALLDDSPGDHIDAASIAKTRLRVEGVSKPGKLTTHEQLLAYVESSLVLMMMKEEPVPSAWTLPSAKSWTAPKDRVRVWLTEERLPEELGWKRSERQLQPADLFPIIKSIFDQKRAQSGRSLWSLLAPSFLGGGERDEL